jgi:hypothetical protein
MRALLRSSVEQLQEAGSAEHPGLNPGRHQLGLDHPETGGLPLCLCSHPHGRIPRVNVSSLQDENSPAASQVIPRDDLAIAAREASAKTRKPRGVFARHA